MFLTLSWLSLAAENQRPVIRIDSETAPIDNYLPNGKIRIAGQVDDENYVVIKYNFDNGYNYTYESVDTTPEGLQEFSTTISIPNTLNFPARHNFSIWAEDLANLTSDVLTYNFTLSTPPYPIVHSAYLSDKRPQPGDKIVVFGEATDPDAGQNVSLYATFDDADESTYLGSFTSQDKLLTYAFFYTIPNTTYGNYELAITAVDDTNRRSEVASRVSLSVVDPSAPKIETNWGNITDVSAKTITKSSNALFNLQYTDPDGNNRSMSYKDEGFFAAYRLYQANNPFFPRDDTHLIRYNDGQTSTTDDITVQFHTQYDDTTGFLQLVFDVTNNGYFPQYVDLGVFVDSDFSDDDNSAISMRPDGRGFVVSSNGTGYHYTVFTKDMEPFTPVSYVYLKDVNRTGNGELPVNQMPFFSKSDATSYNGTNAMYAFSWKRRIINGGTTMRYGATVAPHDSLKTPSRILDRTSKKAYYNPNDVVELNFQILDGDVGEKIDFVVNLNGTESHYNFTATKDPYVFKMNISVGNGPTFRYQVRAVDEDVLFPSNLIDVVLPVSKPPSLTLYKEYLKNNYFEGDSLILAGTVSDEKFVSVYYKIGNGRSEIAGNVTISSTRSFNFTVPIPPQVKPRQNYWELQVWAVDEYGIRQTEAPTSHSFILAERHPPILYNAGLNFKTAKPGDKLIAFAVVNDTQIDRNIDIYIKFGPNGDFVQAGRYWKYDYNLDPFAFYWYVPTNVEPGTYEVSFRARDADGLFSDRTIIRTLIINHN